MTLHYYAGYLWALLKRQHSILLTYHAGGSLTRHELLDRLYNIQRLNSCAAGVNTPLSTAVLAVCPPGYGKIAEEDLPSWWAGRRLLELPAASNSTAGSNSSVDPQQQHEQATTLGLPAPPPPWATECLPCPVDFYSPGGALGFVQCKSCPAGWTTGNASASVDCLGKAPHVVGKAHPAATFWIMPCPAHASLSPRDAWLPAELQQA